MRTKIYLSAFADEAGSSLKEQIVALKRNKISYLEIRGVGDKNISDLTNEEAKEAYNLLKKNKIKVWSIGSPLGKVDIKVSEKEFLEKTRRICEIAKIFNCKNVRMFSFYNARKSKKKVFSLLNKATKLAKDFGVYLCHENEKDIYGDVEPHVSELLKNVPDLKIVYDPGNFVYCNQEIAKSISTLGSKAYYFHIKDCILGKQIIVPAGEGDARIKDIVEQIKKNTVLTIEPHLMMFSSYKGFDSAELKNKYKFKNNKESFDFAVKSLKAILKKVGYKEGKGVFCK